MRWYAWKFWRIARSPNRSGTTFDGFGRWEHVAAGWWWLAAPGEVWKVGR